jgi:hypothetical protein
LSIPYVHFVTAQEDCRGEVIMKFKLTCVLVVVAAVCLAASVAWADSLELNNGSLIRGKFLGGTEQEIRFQVGSSVQKYNVADVVSLRFEAESARDLPADQQSAPSAPTYNDPGAAGRGDDRRDGRDGRGDDRGGQMANYVTIPAGTRISVRTIDRIDSTTNKVGDRFQASLHEPLMVGDNVVVAKGTDVYGKLAEAKQSGTFAGKSQLRLELTGIVVNGQTVPIVTGEYELTGKSRGASTAKRTVGGAVIGTLIGAAAGGGKGAAIGAGVGGAAGAGSETITKGDQVKIPSETLLDFTLQKEVSIPTGRS